MYPYTIIKPKNVLFIYNTLKSLGYSCLQDAKFFMRIARQYGLICVVINDSDRFGNFWFYPEDRMNKRITRYQIKELNKFLQECAKLQGEFEY